MQIFLNGGGCGEQTKNEYELFVQSLGNKKNILYIPLAMDYHKYDCCYSWISGEFSRFPNVKITMIRSSKELSEINLKEYSGIFIGGGNTFKLLKDLKANGNMEKIKDYLQAGGVVFGGSAGAIIFGKDIKVCDLVDDNSEIKLEDTTGFDLLDGISILCHYNNNDTDTQNNIEYIKKLAGNNTVLYIPEENTIIIKDDEIEVLTYRDFVYINGKNVLKIKAK